MALTMLLGSCALPQPGVAPVPAPDDPGATDVPAANQDRPDGTCSMIDQVYYQTSRDLENAADVIVRGEITSIELDDDGPSGPAWIVGFRGDGASFGAGVDDPAVQQVMGDTTVIFPRICGDAPYGDTFAVGSRYILLLSGHHADDDFWFSPIQTTQGVIPIIDGAASPLPGADVTISLTTAAMNGAPMAAPAAGEPFVAAEIAEGWPETVQPQFGNANAGAAWSPEPGVLWVLTSGSSGCPTYASAQAEPDGDGVRIVLSSQLGPDDACVSDLIYYTSRVAVPAGTDESEPLTVHFAPDGTMGSGNPATIVVPPRGEYDLAEAAWAPPNIAHQMLNADSLLVQAGGWASGIPTDLAAATAGTNSRAAVAWTGVEGLMYVVTWGSSSCPMRARHFADQHDGAVWVELLDQAAGRRCTMDWAPTTSIVAVPAGVDNGEPLTAKLGDLGEVTVPPRSPDWDPGLTNVIGPVAVLN